MNFFKYIFIIMLISCGLPDYGALDNPTANKDGNVINIQIPPDDNLKGFDIYVKYSPSNPSSEFTEQDYLESNLTEIRFLQQKKFNKIVYSVANISSYQYFLEYFAKTQDTDQKIIVKSGIDSTVEDILKYTLNNNSVQDIGNFEISHLQELIGLTNYDENIIIIEFAILLNGVNINQNFQKIFSYPVYLGSFVLQL